MSWDQVLKGLMDLYDGMRLERLDASLREKQQIQICQEEHRRRIGDSRVIVASADSGAEGAPPSDAGTRVGRFKRQRLSLNCKHNDGDTEVARDCTVFDNEVALSGFAVARSGNDRAGYEFLLVRKPSQDIKLIYANIRVKAEEEIVEEYRRTSGGAYETHGPAKYSAILANNIRSLSSTNLERVAADARVVRFTSGSPNLLHIWDGLHQGATSGECEVRYLLTAALFH